MLWGSTLCTSPVLKVPGKRLVSLCLCPGILQGCVFQCGSERATALSILGARACDEQESRIICHHLEKQH